MPLEWPFHAITLLCLAVTAAIAIALLRTSWRAREDGPDFQRHIALAAAIGATCAAWIAGYVLRTWLLVFAVVVLLADPPAGGCVSPAGCHTVPMALAIMAAYVGVPLLTVLLGCAALAMSDRPLGVRMPAGAIAAGLGLAAVWGVNGSGQYTRWPGATYLTELARGVEATVPDRELIVTLDAGRPVIRWR